MTCHCSVLIGPFLHTRNNAKITASLSHLLFIYEDDKMLVVFSNTISKCWLELYKKNCKDYSLTLSTAELMIRQYITIYYFSNDNPVDPVIFLSNEAKSDVQSMLLI